MDIPKNCPVHEDKLFPILHGLRILVSIPILIFINIYLLIGYVLFSLLLNTIIINKFLCKYCVYELGSEVDSIESFRLIHGKKFNKRQKIIFPFLMFDWFFVFAVGLFYTITFYLLLYPSEEAMRTGLIDYMITFLLIHFIITQILIKRTPKKHCSSCIYRKYCPAEQNRKSK